MTEETSQQLPSMKPSDGADAPQLRLAKKQGDAYIISCSRSASAMALLGCAKGSHFRVYYSCPPLEIG